MKRHLREQEHKVEIQGTHWDRLNNSPQRCPSVNSWNLQIVVLHDKRDFVGMITDLEMGTLSRIIWLDLLESQNPCKRDPERVSIRE